jgi:hypothetical protein
MESLTVLWLDDDSPGAVPGFEGVTFVTAQSCSQAESLLESGRVNPDWVIVDLSVPQGRWCPAQGAEYVQLPGLAYIGHLKETHGSRLGILAYSAVMPSQMREMALTAGAVAAYGKFQISLADLIGRVRTGTLASRDRRGLRPNNRGESDEHQRR